MVCKGFVWLVGFRLNESICDVYEYRDGEGVEGKSGVEVRLGMEYGNGVGGFLRGYRHWSNCCLEEVSWMWGEGRLRDISVPGNRELISGIIMWRVSFELNEKQC
jgi:hypothetical protein